jgi:hypothetical protein
LLFVVLHGQLRFEHLIDRDRRAAHRNPETRFSLAEGQIGGISQDQIDGRDAGSDGHGVGSGGAQQLEQGGFLHAELQLGGRFRSGSGGHAGWRCQSGAQRDPEE